MAEVYDVGVSTVYPYANSDTSYFQTFNEYQSLVEAHPAYSQDGSASDTVIYTDVNFYIAIDSIDPNKAQVTTVNDNGEIVTQIIDTGGYIKINPNFVICSENPTVQLYQGDRIEVFKIFQ